MNRRAIVLLGVICGTFCSVFSVPAMAQDFPKIEAFGGYSYVHFKEAFNDKGGHPVVVRSNLNGAVGALTFNATKTVGIVAEFGGYHFSKATADQAGSSSQSLNASSTVFSYLFGPRISLRKKVIVPFGQALFGGAHSSSITGSGNPPCPTAAACTALGATSSFAMAIGGGLDVKTVKHISIRLGQIDYLFTRFNTLGGTRSNQNNYRYSAGIVFALKN